MFATGTSYYGVSDLEPFATFTHKFEFKYNDMLVGPWPETAELWAERSPVRHTDRLSGGPGDPARATRTRWCPPRRRT